jgi:hypothetical protein
VVDPQSFHKALGVDEIQGWYSGRGYAVLWFIGGCDVEFRRKDQDCS